MGLGLSSTGQPASFSKVLLEKRSGPEHRLLLLCWWQKRAGLAHWRWQRPPSALVPQLPAISAHLGSAPSCDQSRPPDAGRPCLPCLFLLFSFQMNVLPCLTVFPRTLLIFISLHQSEARKTCHLPAATVDSGNPTWSLLSIEIRTNSSDRN